MNEIKSQKIKKKHESKNNNLKMPYTKKIHVEFNRHKLTETQYKSKSMMTYNQKTKTFALIYKTCDIILTIS